MKKIRRLMNQRGISLLEVMVAMIIMSVSLIVLLNMGMVALDGNDWSNKTTIATQMMAEKLEQLRNVPNLSSANSGTDTISDVQRAWAVSSVGSYLREVTVAVSWRDIRGRQVADTLSAFIKTDSL